MKRWKYILLIVLLISLFISLSTLNRIEEPLIEKMKLPRCSNDVIVSSDLQFDIISYANERIIQGTGESYFNNHFIFKNADYSIDDCVFVVRYEYSYFSAHSEMSLTVKVVEEDYFEIISTNSFLRPVGVLVNEETAMQIAEEMSIDYDYYNLEIDIFKQTFFYKFYKKSLTEGSVEVFSLDAQSSEMKTPSARHEIIPLI